ncbi:DUF4118 domain-containing protein [Edaphobacter sp. HDX4]
MPVTDARDSIVHRSASWPRLTHLQRDGLAFVSVGIAFSAALLLNGFEFHDSGIPLLLFAIAVSSWYGGAGPAVLALVLSSLSFDYFFTEPLHSFSIQSRMSPTSSFLPHSLRSFHGSARSDAASSEIFSRLATSSRLK